MKARGAILQNEFPPDLFFAQLDLARSYRNIGDRERALSEYQNLVRLLENADDIPVFNQARSEAEQFGSEIKPVTRIFIRPSYYAGYTIQCFRGGGCYE